MVFFFGLFHANHSKTVVFPHKSIAEPLNMLGDMIFYISNTFNGPSVDEIVLNA